VKTRALRALFTRISIYDLVFVLTAIAFNLLIAGIFVAQKKGRLELVKTIGTAWLLLAIPLAIVFVKYLVKGRDLWIMICFGSVFLYMFLELLLDYILRIEFRQKPITHVPYIIMEYIALFSLIGISTAIDRTWGYIVGISFWILMGSLVYLYWP
jgi:hypothetical protein